MSAPTDLTSLATGLGLRLAYERGHAGNLVLLAESRVDGRSLLGVTYHLGGLVIARARADDNDPEIETVDGEPGDARALIADRMLSELANLYACRALRRAHVRAVVASS